VGVQETQYCYDGSSSYTTPPTTGNLTTVRKVLTYGAGGQCVDVGYGYDEYGNQTSISEWGNYGTTDGPLATGDERTTATTYESTFHTFPETSTNVLGQQTRRAYDARWGVVSSATDINGLTTSYQYDIFGRLTEIDGPMLSGPGGVYQPTTKYTYDLPATTPAQRTTMTIQKQVRTDAGGSPAWLSSWSIYDGAGRVVQTYAPAGDGSGGVTIVNTHSDGRGLVSSVSTPHTGSGPGGFLESDWLGYAGPFTQTSYDELRRATRVVQPNPNYTIQTAYDGWNRTLVDQNLHQKRFEQDCLGRTLWIREYSGTFATPNASASPYASTNYTYDPLDRLLSVTDQLGNHTRLSYDLLGRKISMQDPDMGAWGYAYDALSLLTAQTDALNQVTSFAYDRLKRPVRTFYPPSWTSATVKAPTVYDLMELRHTLEVHRQAAGLTPMTWTDAVIVAGRGVPVRAQHFVDLYTALQDLWTQAGLGTLPGFTRGPMVPGSRLMCAQDVYDVRNWIEAYEQSSYGQTHGARIYQEYDAYDFAADQYGRGRRTALWDVTGHAIWMYDAIGRAHQEQRTIDGLTYTTTTSFDALSRPASLTLPDGEQLSSSYGASGLLVGLTSSLGPNFVSEIVYNAMNQPTRWTLGSQPLATTVLQTYNGLDGVPMNGSPFGTLRTSYWPSATPTLVNRGLVYDGVGNITSSVDGVNNEVIAYAYDEQNRLSLASAPPGETFGYNEIGNLIWKGSPGNPLTYPPSGAGSAQPHAVTSFAGTSYTYDANGSLTTRGDQHLTYDARRQPVRLDESNGSTVWRTAYDGDGIRRKRLDASGTVHYVGGYEHHLGDGTLDVDTVTKYYVALGRTVAYRNNGVLYWVGTDHLGGTLRVTDSNFNPLDQMRYTPYGVGRDAGSNLGTDHLFTGQIEDQSIGLYWYATRAYDPTLGRFCCPDSIVPSPIDPQSLNRYSYVRNNPLIRVDPTGNWDLSTYAGRQAARDALGPGYVVDASSIYNRSSGTVYSGSGQVIQQTGRTNLAPIPMANPLAVLGALGDPPSLGEIALAQSDGSSTLPLSANTDAIPWLGTPAGELSLADLLKIMLALAAAGAAAAITINGTTFSFYYRRESTTQTPYVALLQQISGEIWGGPPEGGGFFPAVQAYYGHLPSNTRGLEFVTDIQPDSGTPPNVAYWRGPRPGVTVDNDVAKLGPVLVTQNSQTFLDPTGSQIA